MGRPRILEEHPDLVDELVALLEQGVPQSAAAPAVGIHRATFQGWKARGREEQGAILAGETPDPNEAPYLDFVDRVEEARSKAETKFTLYVSRAAAGGDVGAAKWWLDRARPERWAQRQRHEVTGGDGEAVRIELVWGNGNGNGGSNGNGGDGED